MTRRLLAASAALLLCIPLAANAADKPIAAPAATVSPAAAPVAPASLAPHGDIADTLKASGQFTILTKALDQTNLTSVLKGRGPLTLIAPTDAAFQALPPAQLQSLMDPANAQQLQALLVYHVINTSVPLSKVEGTKGPVQTASGAKVEVDGSGATIKFNDAEVTAMSTTTNGSIYVVDKVLTPAPVTASIAPTAGKTSPNG